MHRFSAHGWLAAVATTISLGAACTEAPTAGDGDDDTGGSVQDASSSSGLGDARTDGTPRAEDGAVLDAVPPTLVAVEPAAGSVGVDSAVPITVEFSEPMDEASLRGSTFELTLGDSPVGGQLTTAGSSLTFTPASSLPLGATFAASVSTAAKDLAGNALAASQSWTFTTSTTGTAGGHGPAPVLLGASGTFVLLAEMAIGNTPTSVVTGDVGLSPGASSALTGFATTAAGTHATSAQVAGSLFTTAHDAPTPAALTAAVAAMSAAYDDAASRPAPDFEELGGGSLGGLTLVPGSYAWSTAVSVPSELVLEGGPHDTWILQVGAALDLAAGASVVLRGGARPENVFWQVAGAVNLGASAHVEGILLGRSDVTLGAGASVHGRVLAENGILLSSASVTAP